MSRTRPLWVALAATALFTFFGPPTKRTWARIFPRADCQFSLAYQGTNSLAPNPVRYLTRRVLGSYVTAILFLSSAGGVRADSEPKQTSLGTVFVDQMNGEDDDSRTGGEDQPYASITFALRMLGEFEIEQPWEVKIKEGTYSATAENAEEFPISLHTGMRLIGVDGPDKVIISGKDNPNKSRPLVYGSDATGVRISGIAFQGQTRTGGSQRGGAMELVEFGGEISNCNFIGNFAAMSGGAIWVSLVDGQSLPLSEVSFHGNTVEEYSEHLTSGGAVHVDGDYRGDVTGCTFTSNTTTNRYYADPVPNNTSGGAFYVGGNFLEGDFSECRFVKNYAISNYKGSSGGAIYISGSSTSSFRACTFLENVARASGDSYGGAIYVGNKLAPPKDSGFIGCDFEGNAARRAGGAVFVGQDGLFSLNATHFTKNTVEGYSAFNSGGAVHVTSNFEGTLDGCNFTENKVYNSTYGLENPLNAAGGALYLGGNNPNGAFESCNFIGNRVISRYENSSGGAIHIAGETAASFSGCEFERNKAEANGSSLGGAITVKGALTPASGEGFTTCNFIENTSTKAGAALYVEGEGVFSISETTFTKNSIDGYTSLNSGGAIHFASRFQGDITECIFTSNSVRNTTYAVADPLNSAGGALYFGEELGEVSFHGCEFTNNRTSSPYLISSGGAIYVHGNGAATFQSCTFAGNRALANGTGGGGAIAVNGELEGLDGKSFQRCKFIDNTAEGAGGAIFVGSYWNGSIESSDFIRNSGESRNLDETGTAFGGAIAIVGSFRGDILSNLFSDNQITPGSSGVIAFGGALGIRGTLQGLIQFNNFAVNRAAAGSGTWSGGGAIGVWNKLEPETIVSDNVFSRNRGNYGGAIYLRYDGEDPALLYNNHFLYNESPNVRYGGAAIFTRQNMTIANNTIWGASAEATAIALWEKTGGTTIQNNMIGKIGTGVHIESATIINQSKITNNNFFDVEDILAKAKNGLGHDLVELGDSHDGDFSSNIVTDPLLVGEGHDTPSSLMASGSWDKTAEYSELLDATVFTDSDMNWAVGQWKGCMLNLSQSPTDQTLREQYLILDNTEKTITVSGNLAPEYDGVVGPNRGVRGSGYTIDSYRLTALSPNIDRGAPVVDVERGDVSPTTDYEGDSRPLNCGIDIGADEGYRPLPQTIVLVGPERLCVTLGESYIDQGAIALDASGLDISRRLIRTGSVNTASIGIYTITYSFCDAPDIKAQRTVEVSLSCDGQEPTLSANAGDDQSAVADESGNAEFALDASGSFDSDGSIESYIWTGLNGAPDPADEPTPTVNLSEGTYTFELTVRDNDGNEATDRVTITVIAPVASGPNADAGRDQNETVGGNGLASIMLDGRGSTGTGLRYVWTGLNGAPDPADEASPRLTLEPGNYQFQLTVFDEAENSDSDTVSVIVRAADGGTNPTAVASAEIIEEIQGTNVLATVRLDGSASSASNATIVRFDWEGLGEAADEAVITTKLAPGAYSFRLTVTDSNGLSDTTAVPVTVERPDLDTIGVFLSSDFVTGDLNGDTVLSLEEARTVVPYLLDSEFTSLDDDKDGELTEMELVKPAEAVGCSAGRGTGSGSASGDLALVLFTLILLAGGTGMSRKFKVHEGAAAN